MSNPPNEKTPELLQSSKPCEKNSMEKMLLAFAFLFGKSGFDEINRKLDTLLMTNEELAQQLDNLAAQLNKALTEILAEISSLGTVPQSVVDKLTAAQGVAQQLDDLNPDQPPPTP